MWFSSINSRMISLSTASSGPTDISPMFNHPPLVSYFLRGIYSLGAVRALQENGLTFPFLLRLPGIIADFVVVLLMLRLRKRWALPTWSLLLLALSPVSIMVSGFHGNTDPMVAVVRGARRLPCACATSRPRAGVALALSCGIKIVPALLLPAFFWFWYSRQRTMRFLFPFIMTGHRDLDPATAKLPASVRKKRARIRQLLGTLGHHLLAATDWLVSVLGHSITATCLSRKISCRTR